MKRRPPLETPPQAPAPSRAMLRLGRATACVALVLLPFLTWSAPPPSVTRRAKTHFARAEQAFDAKDYANATTEYMEAYALVPVAALLFDIARSYQAEGKRREAIDYYQRYLAQQPNGPAHDEAIRQVALLEREAATPPPANELSPPSRPMLSLPVSNPEPVAIAGPVKPASKRGAVGAIVLGSSGLALALTGGILMGLGHADFDNLQRSCAPSCPRDEVATSQGKAIAGDVLLAVGAGALVAGVTWILVRTAQSRTSRAR